MLDGVAAVRIGVCLEEGAAGCIPQFGGLGTALPARGMEHLKLLKVSNILGGVCRDDFVHLSFSASSVYPLPL